MDNSQFQKRQTAHKIRIEGILNSEYIKTEGMQPNYLKAGLKHVSRVNILGAIVDKSGVDDNHNSIMIDDGSGRIPARTFEGNVKLGNLHIGDIVVLIGRPREFSSEKYVIIEAIKKVDPGWAKVRSLEMKKNGSSSNIKKVHDSEDKVDLSPKNRVIQAIKDLDEGDGVFIDAVLSRKIHGAEEIIDRLLKEGDIFELRPGKLKILE